MAEDDQLSVLIEIRDLLRELVETDRRVKLDVEDAVRELGSGKMIRHLRHYFQWNDRWTKLLEERNRRAAIGTYDFIEAHLPEVPFHMDQFAVLETVADDVRRAGGAILDLGVYKGASTRALARMFPNRTIAGFDSFEGLPGNWSHVLKGAFGDISGQLPDMPDNVRLYKGWFSDTLPLWREATDSEHISLLRVDCDIYSSTKDIFDAVGDLLDDDCVICFDELFGYWGWEHHEYKAFMEFAEPRGIEFDYLAYGLTYCIVRLRPTSG